MVQRAACHADLHIAATPTPPAHLREVGPVCANDGRRQRSDARKRLLATSAWDYRACVGLMSPSSLQQSKQRAEQSNAVPSAVPQLS
jgi:hypothetical protein